MTVIYNDFVISDDKARLQPNTVCALLHTTFWAKNRSCEAIVASLAHSICFGVYQGDTQVGFARCVTDYATMYWLCDVIIAPTHRGIGLGKALIDTIAHHPDLLGCQGILRTKDAQGLYEKYGFQSVENRYMHQSK